MPSAEIITIGTEILLGEIVDTNTRYIARHFRNMGIDLYRTITIGDNTERIAEAIRASMQRAEIVITTGGLGPTVDDPTREAVALAMGVATEYREELWQQIVAVVGRYGRSPGENQKRQAYVPQGAIGVENPVGTAPAFIVETERNAVIALPGVPKEMEYLLHNAVIPYLQERFELNEIIKVRLLHTSGVGESTIDEKIAEFETLSNPTVGLAAHTGVVDIRIAAKASSEQEAEALIAGVEAQIRARLGDVIYGADEDTLEGAALNLLAGRGWSLAVVEAGLEGKLLRRLRGTAGPEYRGGESLPMTEAGQLSRRVSELMQNLGTEVGLGVAADPEQRAIQIILHSPNGSLERNLTYGGPHANVPRWAANIGLHWLRRIAGEQP